MIITNMASLHRGEGEGEEGSGGKECMDST